MATYEFTSLTNIEFSLRMPETGRDSSVYCLAAPKTGSVLLNNILKELCQGTDFPYFDFEPQVFQYGFGLNDCPLDAALLLEKPGYVFGGFRQIWLLPYIRRYRTSPKIFLVRDPRDMLVSYFFSITKSHPMPKVSGSLLESLRAEAAGQEIEQYIKSGAADHIVRMMQHMIPQITNLPQVHVFKYEDVVFDKRTWILQLADILKINVSEELLETCLQKYDVMPEGERPEKHIRQVAPGNHKKHLSEVTIRAIEKKFSKVFEFFKYPVQVNAG